MPMVESISFPLSRLPAAIATKNFLRYSGIEYQSAACELEWSDMPYWHASFCDAKEKRVSFIHIHCNLEHYTANTFAHS